MLWANFLHIYQPPDQKQFIMERVVSESYRAIISILKDNPHSRITMSIVGCLLLKLENDGYSDVIEGFRDLVAVGQIELTAGTMYHPFLPKLPDGEVLRQIELNNDIHRFYFGNNYEPGGFYSPEAGYSQRVAEIAASLGYRWTIVDEIAYSGFLGAREYDYSHTPGFYSGGSDLRKIVGTVSGSHVQLKTVKPVVDYRKLYRVKGLGGFLVFFRERVISDALASGQIKDPEQFLRVIKPEINESRYLLTGTDGEAYGHHQKGLDHMLGRLYWKRALKTVTISELEEYFPVGEEVEPIASTWGASEKEIAEGNYYARWHHTDNEIHEKQWALTELAIRTINGQGTGELQVVSVRGKVVNGRAREMLDEALYSCHYWWASAKPWWSIELIERGARMIADAVAVAQGFKGGIREVEDKKVLTGPAAEALKLYQDVVFTAFDWLRSEKVWDLSHRHK